MKKSAKKKGTGRLVPKVGIYVPQHRVAELEEWRDRMNFSELFWSAFDREKVVRAGSKIEETGMSKMLDRLKAEASEDFDAGRAAGLEEGAEWATDFGSLRDIRAIAEGERTFGEGNPATAFLQSDYDYGQEIIDGLYGDCDRAAFDLGFAAGFVKAVQEAWNKVKCHI